MAPMRRKSQGSIRSPHVKRNIHSQVTLEGWLFKLEGPAALKQWKQRWCVLVDFCLFFYKAQHEEKVISSIVLPSYKINPCCADDKVSKKFAFKAEHQNMKTYYFATEDKESMKKWMNAMSLASIVQKSAANDDDDSGFTSYRSQRHFSNRSSSIYNSSATSEPLKQRSNSCGDRVGEMYLGSDDKYPNLYKSTSSQLCKVPPQEIEPDLPRKQPLYANAPPKPRRLTQTDGFPSVYPSDCFDRRESDIILVESGQYNVDFPIESRYGNRDNSMQCLPPPVSTNASNLAYVHSASPYFDAELIQPPPCESYSDDSRIKPPRPHSADFLGRENECFVPQYTSQYCESRQPQRPKSSLECYNRMMDCEDYEFDDYREAVRLQADNFYANKGLMKSRNLPETRPSSRPTTAENVTHSDPKLNTGYESSSSCFSGGPVPSYFQDDRHHSKSSTDSQYRRNVDSRKDSKPGHKESMQRLMEWKQRMLQSPLSRRNQLHSASSDVSSLNSSKQMDYSWQSQKDRAGYKQNCQISTLDRNIPYQNQNLPPAECEVQAPYPKSIRCESSLYSNLDNAPERLYCTQDEYEVQQDKCEMTDKSDLPDGFDQNNIMYCVDSENNEILFSYDTSSPPPTEYNAPETLHTGSHYPPQMHSFSTLSNVNDIGIEPLPTSEQHSPRKHRLQMNNPSKQEPSFTKTRKKITYSSDDEDEVLEDINLKASSQLAEAKMTDNGISEEQQHLRSASPDYVNIGLMHRDMASVAPAMYSSDIVFRSSLPVNKAVLKQLDQVSKSGPKVQPSDMPPPPSHAPEHMSSPYDSSSNRTDFQKNGSEEPTFVSSKEALSSKDFVEDTECDIKREDYYRASQIFYSSMRMKKKLGVSPNKNIQSCILENTPTHSPSKFKNVDNLDGNIGLPLRASKVLFNLEFSSSTPDISTDDLSSDIIKNPYEKQSESEIENSATKNGENIGTKIFGKSEKIGPASNEVKKNRTYEEMRGELLRKREAPPPNIVQERIKKFEKVERSDDVKKVPLNVSKFLESDLLHSNKPTDKNSLKKNHHHLKSEKRAPHSDSEAVAVEDSDPSSDDLTMKSAPLPLSPLSSVLVDLRKTADSGKENVSDSGIDPSKNSEIVFGHAAKSKSSKIIPSNVSHSKVLRDFNLDDVVYLPMSGIKAIKEPEYVTMSDSQLSPSVTDSSMQKLGKFKEEHVYNEPFSAPSSFLHDVYGKQKSKLFQYQIESSSSEDSLTENIYDKPIQRFIIDSSRNSKNDYASKTGQRPSFVLMNSASCLSVATCSQADSSSGRDVFSWSQKTKKNRQHHYEQAHISVSVPDLLQLQEVKDSDASDADDEASRDFDTAGNTALSSYQRTVLDGFYATDNISSFPIGASSKLDAEGKAPASGSEYFNDYKANSNVFHERSTPPKFKAHEKVLDMDSSGDTVSPQGVECLNESNIDVDNCDKILHVRKLKVYTKGKKAETPRMFPVPFNLGEVETCNKKIPNLEESSFSRGSKTEADDFSLSENVAYVSRADINSTADDSVTLSSTSMPASYTPDIISSIKEEETSLNETENSLSKLSSSAPYYYSDLYSGYGINFSSFKQMDLPYGDKTSPPKSCTSLLNNIRAKSPCASKNDIGRKVNNINMEPHGRQIFNDSCSPRSDEPKNNIKHSMGVFQVSESKYLDAEKNKYEAGSTLEKTRPSSTMSYFKHRASTPDLNSCQYLSNEPVYENILFQSKRVSHSLEEIAAASDFPAQEGRQHQDSPVYENIDFFNRLEQADNFQYMQKNEPSSCTFQRVEGVPNFQDVPRSPKYFVEPKLHLSSADTMEEAAYDSRAIFLDQGLLKCSSSKTDISTGDSKAEMHSKPVLDSKCMSKAPVLLPLDLEHAKDKYNPPVPPNRESSLLKYKVNDSDTISDVTSSCDEASADSDNRHQLLSQRTISKDLRSSSSGPEITAKEAMHLKKLVQQSHGLMSRGKRLSVSAGDLLGKTHEELVLLLIQLRRNQSKLLKAKDKLERKINKGREGVLQIDQHRYEELCNQIAHLEKQYEVTQPLVTLVENMVKLGSLYGNSNRRSFSLPILETSQEVTSIPNCDVAPHQSSILSQLMKEEHHLQKHIREINKLEKSLQNETNSISTLHQDKEMLEHTLFGMRNKILDHQDRPAELQKLRKQQRMIEKELIRVKRLLSTSAKKIEDATSKNDQMEQEILHLRQILQQALKTGSTEMKSSQHSRADLEAELTRLQSVLDELANHRHEINNTVEKLKSESACSRSKGTEVRASPTGVAGSAPLPLRKKHHCMYLETDLDTMVTRDLAVFYEKDMDDIPVYANAEEITLSNEEAVGYDTAPMSSYSKPDTADPEISLQDINDADERMKRFYGILPKEKPSEIKTVRIVKRQSERRSRERDKKKVTYDEESSVWIMEEPDLSSDDYLEMDEGNNKKTPTVQTSRPSSIHLSTASSGRQTNTQSAHERLFGSSTSSRKSLSQAYATKKSKRRHYTVSGYQYILDPQFSQYFTETPRSRDDVDMERCLRTANTPDIVRSTIKKKDVFDDSLIDRELGLPQKIEIPERYVEIEPEQLSATEKLKRSLKAENICKMLSETNTSYGDVVEKRDNSPEALHKKLSEEKRKRAQLLSLNQALAREVVERSKAVAVLATLERIMKKPLTPVEEDLSPMTPLPITQQRYNFLT